MKSLSVCLIARDEEENLPIVLSSVKAIADEIIVVDTGSTDDTKRVAAEFTDKIYDFTWIDDFAAARNYSLDKATSDYIMWLDADDYISEKSRKGIKKLKSLLTDEDVVMLPYEVDFDEDGKVKFKYYRERILRRAAGFAFVDPVHEVIVPRGKIIYKELPVTHRKRERAKTLRNLNIYQKMIGRGVSLNARQLFYYANELFYNGMYDEALINYEKFLKNPYGMRENKIQAHVNAARIYLSEQMIDSAIEALTSSFVYGKPTSEVLTEIGNIFLTKKDYDTALFWYKQAIQPIPEKTNAFIETDAYSFIPKLQIGLCLFYLGDIDGAIKYNAAALKDKPGNKICIHNDLYYRKIKEAAR